MKNLLPQTIEGVRRQKERFMLLAQIELGCFGRWFSQAMSFIYCGGFTSKSPQRGKRKKRARKGLGIITILKGERNGKCKSESKEKL